MEKLKKPDSIREGRPLNFPLYQSILLNIAEKKQPVNELCLKIGHSYANTKRMVDLLKERGLVQRTFAGKEHPVVLTEAGADVVREWEVKI